MSVIRTTMLSTTDSMLEYTSTAANKYKEVAQQSSSGIRVDEPSDDPDAAKNILNTNTQLSKLDGYLSNIKTSQNELDVVDGALSSSETSIQNAIDYATQTANGVYTPTDLASVKNQIDSIISGLVTQANTQFDSNYVFSGSATSTAAYTINKDASGNYTSITYNGNSDSRYTQVSDGVSIPINESGSSIFGSYSSTGGPSTGLLSHLVALSNALGSNDTTTINSSISNLNSDLNGVIAKRSEYAAIGSKFDMTTTAINSQELTLKSYKSDLQEVDVTKSYTELAAQQYALQATMQIASKMLSAPTLLDYLK